MARLARAEVIDSNEVAIAHVINRTVRRCFLMGDDEFSGKNFDHRKVWIEDLLQRFAAHFGIDLISYSILSNHYHLVLRSRPDVVATWSDQEVSRRWLMICPLRSIDGKPAPPNQAEIDSVANCPLKLANARERLSSMSWWVRLLNQRIAQRSNREENESGRFWQDRFRLIKLIDEESLLACMAYVDLNPIRAAMAETIEGSDHTSVQRRVEAIEQAGQESRLPEKQRQNSVRRDAFLAKLEIVVSTDSVGPRGGVSGSRCSDKGVLEMDTKAYLNLLDWTARQRVPGKKGATSDSLPPVFQRLNLDVDRWGKLMDHFEEAFVHLSGRCDRIENSRSHLTSRRFRISALARMMLPSPN